MRLLDNEDLVEPSLITIVRDGVLLERRAIAAWKVMLMLTNYINLHHALQRCNDSCPHANLSSK
jgi:hypothetical protein